MLEIGNKVNWGACRDDSCACGGIRLRKTLRVSTAGTAVYSARRAAARKNLNAVAPINVTLPNEGRSRFNVYCDKSRC